MKASNPLLPGLGVCDPHVRVYGGRAWLYATHDRSPSNSDYSMDEWWVWSSDDLVRWRHECSLAPADTYIGPGFHSCWATDAAERDGRYYWYFSEGARRAGVVTAESPGGPWMDPLGRPLIEEGLVPTKAYDPGIITDRDGSAYIVFGVWDYYIARLGDDMISLAGKPRRIEIVAPEGPYGPGRTDDKPYLHERAGIYYLSWGCFYGMSDNIYGPYECRGSIIREDMVAPRLGYRGHPVTMDRHGSFFEWKGEWYFICNDMSRSGSPYFRDSSLCRVGYRRDGTMEPVRLDEEVEVPDL